MKLSRTKILLFVSFTLFLISFGFCVFLFKVIVNKNIHTVSLKETLDEKVKQKQQGSFLMKSIKDAVDENKVVDSYFVSPDSIDSFVSSLEKDSNSFGNRTSVSSVEFIKNDKKTINIGLSIEGTFVSVMKSIKMVEYMPHLVNIKSISLNANYKNKDGTPAVSTKKGDVWYPWVADISFDVYTF